MPDPTPDEYLLDQFIGYSDEQKLSLDEAAQLLASYAKQRVPEYRIQQRVARARNRVSDEISQSPRESLIIRVLVRSRIHSITWPYYPQFHVVGTPIETHWYSIDYPMPVWKGASRKNYHYLDDLYYDEAWERFWMPEPYLEGLPTSAALFRFLAEKRGSILQGTSYRKVEPKLVTDCLKLRRNTPIYKIHPAENGIRMYGRKPYGSKDWKDRVSVVSKYYRAKK